MMILEWVALNFFEWIPEVISPIHADFNECRLVDDGNLNVNKTSREVKEEVSYPGIILH